MLCKMSGMLCCQQPPGTAENLLAKGVLSLMSMLRAILYISMLCAAMSEWCLANCRDIQGWQQYSRKTYHVVEGLRHHLVDSNAPKSSVPILLITSRAHVRNAISKTVIQLANMCWNDICGCCASTSSKRMPWWMAPSSDLMIHCIDALQKCCSTVLILSADHVSVPVMACFCTWPFDCYACC